MLMRLMSKGEYLIVPKGTKFTGAGKLGLKPFFHLVVNILTILNTFAKQLQFKIESAFIFSDTPMPTVPHYHLSWYACLLATFDLVQKSCAYTIHGFKLQHFRIMWLLTKIFQQGEKWQLCNLKFVCFFQLKTYLVVCSQPPI